MKKLMTIAVFATLFIIKANAQTTNFGINAGVTLSSAAGKSDGETDNSKSKTGFTAGVVADLPLGGSISFRPALQFTQMGGMDKEADFKYTLTMNYLELPLNMVYKAGVPGAAFFVGLGPSLAYGLGGKAKYEFGGESDKADIHFGSSDDDDFKAFNIGGNVIAGIELAGSVFVALNYNMGFSNLFNDGDSDNSFKTRYAGLRVGFMFGGNKSTSSTTTPQ